MKVKEAILNYLKYMQGFYRLEKIIMTKYENENR